MRPAAHVEPVGAGPVDGQFLALGQFGRPFGLERLAAVLPARDQVLTLPDFPTERFVGGDDLSHLRLDGGQVLVRERTVPWRKIIIESVVRRRAEGRSEEHTSELQSLMRISYAVFCLTKNKHGTYSYYDPSLVHTH